MRWKSLFAVLLGLLMVGVTAGSATALPPLKHTQPTIFENKRKIYSDIEVYPSIHGMETGARISSKDELDPITPQYFGDKKDELSLDIDYDVNELSNGDLDVVVYYDWRWSLTEIFNGPDDQVVILIPWAYWENGKWVTFFRESSPKVTTVFRDAKIREISFLDVTIEDKHVLVARILATVDDDASVEGIWIYMTLKKEYRGLELKTNFIYLHSWGTGSAVSTAGSVILPFVLYFAPAGLGLVASVAWPALDLFIFQRFDGSWTKTKNETLILNPNGNLPPCWNGICPTKLGG